MGTTPDQSANSLLASLAAPEWLRIAPLLEPVDLPLGKVLNEAGCKMSHVYFPINASVSLRYV